MDYQKIENFLDSVSNQPSKVRTRNWVEINDDSRGTYTNADIKFITTMLKSDLCDYADAYIFIKGTITITGIGNDDNGRHADERNKALMFKDCVLFTKSISRINVIDTDNAQDIDIVMPMYKLIEYSDNYSKTSGSLLQYYRDDYNNREELGKIYFLRSVDNRFHKVIFLFITSNMDSQRK